MMSVLSRSFSLSLRLFSRTVRPASFTPTHHMLNNCDAADAIIEPSVDTHHFSPLNMLSLFNSPSNNVGTVAITTYYQETSTSSPSIVQGLVDNLQSLLDMSTWLIKRTFQPSIIRKRRKHGFLRRQESVGGRRVLRRRKHKGRMRLGGS